MKQALLNAGGMTEGGGTDYYTIRGRALGDKGRQIILMTHCEMLDPLMAANDGPNEAHKSYYI